MLSAAHGGAQLRTSQIEETGPDLCEQSWWDEAVAEDARQTGQWGQPSIGHSSILCSDAITQLRASEGPRPV